MELEAIMSDLVVEIPDSVDSLFALIPSPTPFPTSFTSLFKCSATRYYGQDYQACLEKCDPLLDFLWEKLNTGHWKDVSVSWRYAYSVVSLLKGIALIKLSGVGTSIHSNDTIFSEVLKTFDMALLMGAPVKENLIARMSTQIHKKCGAELYRNNQTLVTSLNDICEDDNLPINVQLQGSSQTNSKDKEIHIHLPLDLENTDKCNQDHHLISSSNLEPVKLDSASAKDVQVSFDTDGPTLSKCQRMDGIKDKALLEIERRSCPSLECFQTFYFNSKKPVILTDCMTHWPAMSDRKWSIDYLKSIAGYRTVPIEIGSKYTDDSWTQKLMTLQEFIDKFIQSSDVTKTPVGYLAQHQLFDQIPELRDDIVVPDYCWIGTNQDEVDINAWFGPQGTVSPLHHDPKHNFLAQVVGQKYIQVYSSEMTKYLYPREGLMDNTSCVDVEHPDLTVYPLYSHAVGFQCMLKEGEMLFIPQKYWHFVRSLSLSFSVSFWFE